MSFAILSTTTIEGGRNDGCRIVQVTFTATSGLASTTRYVTVPKGADVTAAITAVGNAWVAGLS